MHNLPFSTIREYNKKYVKKELKKQRAELVKSWKILDTVNNGEMIIANGYRVKLRVQYSVA